MGEQVSLEAYDTESSDWHKLKSLQRFRHACWFSDQSLFIFGGFEHDSPNIPTDSIVRYDIAKEL